MLILYRIERDWCKNETKNSFEIFYLLVHIKFNIYILEHYVGSVWGSGQFCKGKKKSLYLEQNRNEVCISKIPNLFSH